MSGVEREMDRLQELLADRALAGLDAAEASELERLLAESPEADVEAFDRVAAELHAALLEGREAPLPADLSERLVADAAPFVPSAPAEGLRGPTPARRGPSLVAWAGWLAAAAIAVFTVLARVYDTRPQDPALGRQELVDAARDLIRFELAATEDDLVADRDAAGDVVWSPSRQLGYLRLTNLPVNDPGASQYQLWIFDEERKAEHPVDGGVFDVSAEGEVVVGIDAKLSVARPTLFAITVERPGGVVVSEREHIVLLGGA